VKQFNEEESQLVSKAELGLPTFPKESWKPVVFWIIVGLGIVLFGIYKLR
jgi:hypothetical protein